MVMMESWLRISGVGVFLISTLSGLADARIDTHEGIFNPYVRTVSMRNPDNFMSPAIIRLGTSDSLLLNFDIIGDTHDYLCYRVVHCNADWIPSRLVESEFLEGFNEGDITDFAYSSNTYIHYVNYNLIIPNDSFTLKASGNYLLQVYPEENPEDVLLQTRFSVTENLTPISATVTSRTDFGFNTEWQQLDLAIDITGLDNVNPYQDLVVTVMQNNRPETTRILTHPLRTEGSKVVFEHDRNLVFRASNEYRRFETVRADYPGMSVDSVTFGGTNWHAWLTPDSPRSDREYHFDRTQQGRFKVDEYNSTDPDLGADYVTVHFALDAQEMPNSEVYIDGDFNLHRFNNLNIMDFDPSTRCYKGEIPLKQGSYNYQYVVIPTGNFDEEDHGIPEGKEVSSSRIEGDFYETSNEYLIQVFYRPPAARADRLVGTVVALSN